MTKMRLWEYKEAHATIPKVKKHLLALRRNYIKAQHYRRAMTNGDKSAKELCKRWSVASQKRLDVLIGLGVEVYHSAFHGVALFPFRAICNGKKKNACFVYYSTRDNIDDFILRSALEKRDELLGATHKIPDRWHDSQPPYTY